MKKTFLALSILILLTSISIACENTIISAITTDSHKYDGKRVCVEGSVFNLKIRASKTRNYHTTFELNDGKGMSLTVFSFNILPIKEGDKVKVAGIYEAAKRVETYTFYNQIKASRVERLQ